MSGESLNIVLFGAGVVLSVFGWLIRQKLTAQEKENQRLASDLSSCEVQIQDLQREQRNLVTRQELDEYKRDTSTMIESLRSGIKVDLENIRRNEIKELYDVLREETRQTRSEMRDDMNKLTHALQEQLRHIQHQLQRTPA